MSNALHPAHQFRNVVESKASDFLQAMAGTEEGAKAAGRVALAFRQAAQTNDRLYGCDPVSVAQAVALSAMTGLMPGGPLPDVYLLPRGKSLQWQVSHRGFAKLAARSGVRLRTKAVFESDTFHVIEGTEPKLEHVPDLSADQSWDTLVAVYVVAHYKDGSKDFVVIRKADIEKRRANSDSYKRNKINHRGVSGLLKWRSRQGSDMPSHAASFRWTTQPLAHMSMTVCKMHQLKTCRLLK